VFHKARACVLPTQDAFECGTELGLETETEMRAQEAEIERDGNETRCMRGNRNKTASNYVGLTSIKRILAEGGVMGLALACNRLTEWVNDGSAVGIIADAASVGE
jgi:hypothetical protein